MISLESAIHLAVKYHAGQTDKAGQPYILHPLRVMFSLDSTDEKIAGILHDIVEDTECTFEMLEELGLEGQALEAVKLLTRDDQTPYSDYIERLAAHPVARKVKLADLEDNLDITRLTELKEKDQVRINKYLKVRAKLLENRTSE